MEGVHGDFAVQQASIRIRFGRHASFSGLPYSVPWDTR
jgi:hypothetical protein